MTKFHIVTNAFIVIFSLIISGCAAQYTSTSSPRWSEIGKKNAIQGQVMQTEAELTKAYQVDKLEQESYQQYQAGYEDGVNTFCDVNKAFGYGVKGLRYQDQCKGRRDEPQFRYEWNRGFDTYMYPKGPPG
jgi:hypothetical protein